jgi:hypothetical protein
MLPVALPQRERPTRPVERARPHWAAVAERLAIAPNDYLVGVTVAAASERIG